MKEILDSSAYEYQKEIIRKEVNFGDPKDRYLADYSVFKKDAKEKEKLYNMKMKWRAIIRSKGFTKHNYKPANII